MTTRAEEYKEAIDKLIRVESVEALRDILVQEGIQGECGDAWDCAISSYLRKKFDLKYGQVTVDGGGFIEIDSIGFRVKSQVLWDFTDKFDLGKFPELIKEDNYENLF